MSSLQLNDILRALKAGGARLLLNEGDLEYEGPEPLLNELLPFLKANKPALLRLLAAPGALKPKLAAANDNVLPTPRRSIVYKVTVSGKRMTVIDTAAEPYERFVKSIYAQFGVDRVEAIERQ